MTSTGTRRDTATWRASLRRGWPPMESCWDPASRPTTANEDQSITALSPRRADCDRAIVRLQIIELCIICRRNPQWCHGRIEWGSKGRRFDEKSAPVRVVFGAANWSENHGLALRRRDFVTLKKTGETDCSMCQEHDRILKNRETVVCNSWLGLQVMPRVAMQAVRAAAQPTRLAGPRLAAGHRAAAGPLAAAHGARRTSL